MKFADIIQVTNQTDAQWWQGHLYTPNQTTTKTQNEESSTEEISLAEKSFPASYVVAYNSEETVAQATHQYVPDASALHHLSLYVGSFFLLMS